MLLYSDVKTEVRGRCVDSDDLLTDAWFDRQVWDAYIFLTVKTGGFWLNDTDTFTTTTSEAEYALSSETWVIKRLVDTSNRRVLRRIIEEDEAYSDPDRSLTNQPTAYFGTYLRTVQYQPSSASQITIVSSSASDDSDYSVRLRGKLSSGIEVPETVTMDGTTPVVSTNSFVSFKISKAQVSNGYYTVTSNAGAVTNVVLAPEEIQRQYPWIRLASTPGGAYTIREDFLRRPMNVVADTDIFEVPELLEEALVNRYEEKAQRYYQSDSKADRIAVRNELLIKDRMNFAKEKRDQSIRWAGELRRNNDDFMGGLIGSLSG